MLKLDLEAVVEDAGDEVYTFETLKSLIYLKFVGGCTLSDLSIISQNHLRNRLFAQNLSRGGIIIKNLIVLSRVWVSLVGLSFPSSTAVIFSSIREVIANAW
jgi:hypothetical protein